VFGCVDPQSEASRSITAPDGSAKSLSDGCATASDRFFSYYGYYPSGISCTWTGSGWSISVSFYWSGYDSYQTWYYWLGDNNYSIEQSCGDAVLDDIIASYSNTVYYSGSEFPTCYEFKRDTHTEFFTHAELANPEGNGTDWAWLRTSLLISQGNGYGADEWRIKYGEVIDQPGAVRHANSGYRTPLNNYYSHGAPDSRHMHGDALDLQNDTQSQWEWDAMYEAAGRAHADYREPLAESGIGHSHADWRYHN
jgi:hypothetical protein